MFQIKPVSLCSPAILLVDKYCDEPYLSLVFLCVIGHYMYCVVE